jgi:hypothetical protein
MKRARLITLLFALLVLGFLAIAVFRSREPSYQGRSLTEWIGVGGSAYIRFIDRHHYDERRLLPDDPAWQTACHAVKQMAPQAIPLLLKWAQAQDSPLKRKAAIWLNAHPSLHLHVRTSREYHALARQAFGMLENDAKSAWPTLIQLTFSPDPDRRLSAAMCLFNSRADQEKLVPVLLRLLHDPDTAVQRIAARDLHYRFSNEAETAGVYKMFPGMRGIPTEQNHHY